MAMFGIHIASFFVYFAGILLAFLSIGAPYWYIYPKHNGGLWKNCRSKDPNTNNINDDCELVTLKNIPAAWQATIAVSIAACAVSGIAAVFLLVVGCTLGRQLSSTYQINLRKGAIAASTILNLVAGAMVLTAALIFPWPGVEEMLQTEVTKGWAYYVAILSSVIFIITGFLQLAVLIIVARMPIRYEMF